MPDAPQTPRRDGTFVAPGFEPVAACFMEAAAAQVQGGLAFAVVLEGAVVVDLFAGQATEAQQWSATTATCTMSVSKGLAGLCIAMLVDRGLLDVDASVARYWPAFARDGKEAVTVRHVLLHQAGVLGIPDVRGTLGDGGAGWRDLDRIAAALEAAKLAWKPGAKAGYHAVTSGWLLGELVRRVDGRTLGAFFHEEVAAPLGVRTAIGVAEGDLVRLADAHMEGVLSGADAGGRLLLARTNSRARDPRNWLGQALLSDGQSTVVERAEHLVRDPDWLGAEVPSSNGVTSAHDLARIFAAIAQRGSLDGVELLRPRTHARFAVRADTRVDAVMSRGLDPARRLIARKHLLASRTLGWLANTPNDDGWGPFGPSPRAVGSGGLGGHVAIADPDVGLSAAFVRSQYSHDHSAPGSLLNTLYECLPRQSLGVEPCRGSLPTC